ncbi:hypothetical protein DF185_06630 [Marinifilum breve]|uniref:DUF4437 domain-containing protein n=1 Tax=Marinifilum breve TaxID=2184082 RepID=A0A2V4A0Y0_9BACT|nr:DUF4437 domain-containing protein [Marinifilum breve]PXY02318.1 hypothetical protein DF185_06630 [Marinifilum breve]
MRIFLILALASTLSACSNSKSKSDGVNDTNTKAIYELVLRSEVEWTHLNPKRGDLAPKAGTLWGDRKGTEPTGFLLKPTDGFSSPPHIHNVSYRGVVISGVIHNDDPNAGDMWMPSGSFWIQPKGHVHITSAKSNNTIAYVEIEEGPYLVLPPEEHFDSGERPVNVDETNIVWLGASDIKWIDQPEAKASKHGVKMAFLWGSTESGQLNGTFIKLPAGFSGKIISHASSFRAVVIKGLPKYHELGKTEMKTLEPGSYFASMGGGEHTINSDSEEESIFYVRTDGKYEVNSTK